MSKVSPWEVVTLKLWHGGCFTKIDKGLVYNGRSFSTVGVDPDELCWFTILEEAEKCSNFRRNVDVIFYIKPGIGLQKAEDDRDASVICEDQGILLRGRRWPQHLHLITLLLHNPPELGEMER